MSKIPSAKIKGKLPGIKWHCNIMIKGDPIDSSPPGSPVPGILQARTLEWGAISFSNAWKWKVKVKSLSRVLLLANPGTGAYQAPLSMGFSRQEYWSGVPLPSPVIKVIILIKATLPYHQLEKECPLRKMSKEHEQTIYKRKNTCGI